MYRETSIGLLARLDRDSAREEVLKAYRTLSWKTCDVATHFGVSRRHMVRLVDDLGISRHIARGRIPSKGAKRAGNFGKRMAR